MIREFNGSFVYQVPLEGFNPERFFIEMEKNRARLRITDWGISQCSLEDVFMRICEVNANWHLKIVRDVEYYSNIYNYLQKFSDYSFLYIKSK